MIANRQELLKIHNDKSAKLVLGALEVGLHSVLPEILIKSSLKYDGGISVRDIYGTVFHKKKFDRVFVVGAGKATLGMAGVLQSILGSRIAEGAITVPQSSKTKINGIVISTASHPVPSKSGIDGTKKIINILGKAKADDLVIVLISGGGSALMPLPAPGITLRDKQIVTNSLLRSGATIHEINAVRKHLSSIKGGQLIRYIDKSCTVISLILSDVVGDNLDVIASGPTVPDNSTFADVSIILKKHNVKTPHAVKNHISRGLDGIMQETPKDDDPIFARVCNVLIGNNAIACKSAVKFFKRHHIPSVHIGSKFEGDAKTFGTFLARIASDLGDGSFALVAGGETVVELNKIRNGKGGRNQEAALAYMIELERRDLALACIGTDGIDGNSDAAGALVSQKTINLGKKIDLGKYLDRHDSYHAFKKLRSLVFTGYTGTNVNDIAIMCHIKKQA